jgi:aromatic ring hydroxylase
MQPWGAVLPAAGEVSVDVFDEVFVPWICNIGIFLCYNFSAVLLQMTNMFAPGSLARFPSTSLMMSIFGLLA